MKTVVREPLEFEVLASGLGFTEGPVIAADGTAGEATTSAACHVERLDQLLYDFPDLVVVMRHGAEPCTELAVKRMLKRPNLYYSTDTT